jgi:hypothetical protein
MAKPDRKGPTSPEKVNDDAKGAMAPSQADPKNDGALAIKDATQPPHDHSWPTKPKTDTENAGEE